MKKNAFKKIAQPLFGTKTLFIVFALLFGFAGATMAATTPSLGSGISFGVIGGTYLNDSITNTINGDVGFTTPPAATPGPLGLHPSVTYPNYGDTANATAQARLDTASALTALSAGANAACTRNGVGVANLGTDTTHNGGGTPGLYEPGVYCTDGAVTAANITLSGAGTYIFRIAGALDTTAGDTITLTNGADPCNVFWTPTAATTLAANTNFVGVVIANATAINIGSNVFWTGQALNLGAGSVGTLGSVNYTITVPICTVLPGTGTLNIIKSIINLGGGTAVASDFIMNLNTSTGVFVASGVGTGTPGTSYLLSSGVYTVTETVNASYTTSMTGSASFLLFIGDCANFTISSGDDKTCIVLNTYIIPPVIPSGGGGGGGGLLMDVCVTGDYSASYYDGICYPPVAPVVHAAPGGLPIIAIVKVADRLTPFPYGGGNVTYTYVVTNPGDVPLSSINISDDTCAPLALVGGDINRDHLLDIGEIWTYTCSTRVSVSTRNVAIVTGIGDGVTVTDTDFANVVVVPGLPRTGLTPSTPWNIIIFAGVILIVSSIVFVVIRKRKI